MTVSNGGSDLITSSKASGCAISSTITKSSCSFRTFGWFVRIFWPLASDRTLVTTEWPALSNSSRMWAAIKPLRTIKRGYCRSWLYLRTYVPPVRNVRAII